MHSSHGFSWLQVKGSSLLKRASVLQCKTCVGHAWDSFFCRPAKYVKAGGAMASSPGIKEAQPVSSAPKNTCTSFLLLKSKGNR